MKRPFQQENPPGAAPPNEPGADPACPPDEFDELSYLDLNPDVLRSVHEGHFSSGYDHWVRVGSAERRALRPAPGAPPEWNECRYLRLNPDIASLVQAGEIPSGYHHWTRHGQYEGRPGGILSSPRTSYAGAISSASAGVNMLAFHGTDIGLGTAARGYAEALRPLLPVHEVPIPWKLDNLQDKHLAPLRHAVNVIHMNPDALPLFLARFGTDILPGRFNIGIWVWELHAGYAHWFAQSRLFNEIWSPSTYSASAIQPVSLTPVNVIPHVVDDLPMPQPMPRSELGVHPGAFLFLYVFDMASTFERKNPLALVRAFRRAFGNRTDVQLVLKYHHSQFDLSGARLLDRLVAGAPNIRTINQTLPQEQVYAMLRCCDCFVSPHRSEGFGLNIAAAMYFGKPVIATGYSGNLDFTTPENSFLIDYELVAVRHDAGAYKSNFVWAEPSEDHLSDLLRTVIESPDETNRRAERGRRTIQERCSVKAVSQAIHRRLTAWQSEPRT